MSLPYYTLYPKDFDADETVRGMSFAEKGLYLTLLNHAWVNDGLPEDPARVARIAGAMPDEFAELWPGVEPCFPVTDGRRRNRRQEEERATAQRKIAHGKAGAEARWKGKNLCSGNAPVMPEHSSSIARGVPRAYDSLSSSEKEKKLPSDDSDSPKLEIVSRVDPWKAAGFDGPDAADAWWKALVARHPNHNRSGSTRGKFLDLVLTGQFDRTQFEKWYQEQVPIWNEWKKRQVLATNLGDMFTDCAWRIEKTEEPMGIPPEYFDPKRYELGD